MPSTKKINIPNVGDVEFEQAAFVVKQEEWNEYILPGHNLKIRSRNTAVRVWIAKDGRKAPDGSPLVYLEGQNQVVADDLMPDGLQ